MTSIFADSVSVDRDEVLAINKLEELHLVASDPVSARATALFEAADDFTSARDRDATPEYEAWLAAKRDFIQAARTELGIVAPGTTSKLRTI